MELWTKNKKNAYFSSFGKKIHYAKGLMKKSGKVDVLPLFNHNFTLHSLTFSHFLPNNHRIFLQVVDFFYGAFFYSEFVVFFWFIRVVGVGYDVFAWCSVIAY